MEEEIDTKTNIILIDSFSELDKILSLVNKNSIVYTFDYDSHKKLLERGISHKISELVLNENNIAEIQKNVYHFSSWYNNKNFTEFLIFNGINIGRLFHEEFLDYLVQFLKKFYEIYFLTKFYPESRFLAGGEIFEILSLIQKNNQEIVFSKNEYSFTHDKVRFSIPIGTKNLSIFLPFSFYKKIKNLSEKFFEFFLKDNNNPSTLFVEFNTIRYKTLLQNGKKYDTLISLFGLRRPTFWNFESYKIIKNSNCNVITQNSLLKHYRINLHDLDKIKNNLESLFINNIFIKYFSLFGISFDSIISKILKTLILPRIASLLSDINSIDLLFQKHKINSIVLLSEVGYTEQLIQYFAKQNCIPTYMLHLGLHYDTFEAAEMNSSQSVYPFFSDKFFVWGEIVKKDAQIHANIPENKIVVTGNPRFDDYFKLITKDHGYILLATSGPQHEDVNGLLVKNYENYEKIVSQICEIVQSLKKDLVIKLHPSVKEFDITDLAKSYNSKIKIFKEGEIYPLVQNCSCMIVLGLSTAIIEAQILQKPVISITTIDYGLGIPSVFSSGSCIISDISSLKDYLCKLDDENYKQDVITHANKFLDDYLSHQQNSVKTFYDNLNELNNQSLS